MNSNLCLIIPAYNPTGDWAQLFLNRYVEFSESIDCKLNVLLVDDGSSLDLSTGISFLNEKIGSSFKCISYPKNKGKGGALKAGANGHNSDWYMFTDIDFPYDVKSMRDVFETIKANNGIVSGFREEKYYDDLSNFRTILSKMLRFLNSVILRLPVNDTQCGLKAFDTQAKDVLLQCKTNRFLIDLEFLLAANQKGIDITPVLVKLREEIEFSRFNASVLLKEVFSFIKIIFKYRVLSRSKT